jgi:MFS family permease
MNSPTSNVLSSRSIVMIGLISLALAMGIGRFAFTPLMPLMVRDASLQADTGAEWAVANYIGYLVGALSASWFSQRPRTGLQLGLLGVGLSTLGMASVQWMPPWTGGLLRGIAGIGSAWVLVCASSWCLPELARRQSSALGGWMYTGVGVGIALTGVVTWLGGHQSALMLWIELGLMAMVGAGYVRQALVAQGKGQATSQTGSSDASASEHASAAGHYPLGLIFCYGAFGFGYIIPATFLPTMARQLVDDPLVFGLTWPLFGLAAALSVAWASRWLASWPRRRVWALAQAMMAGGTLIPLLQQSLEALALSAVLIGGTFMVATMAGLQLAREKMPANPTPLLSRMTGSFAAGQIAGPLLIRLMGLADIAQSEALNKANGIATMLLIATSVWLWLGE